MFKDNSLADFVIQSFERARHPVHRKTLWPLASVLKQKGRMPAVKRFSYDKKVQDILDSLRAVPIEDFIAQFPRIVMPFDTFWIETAPPEKIVPRTVQRTGFC